MIMEDAGKVKSLTKALMILECFISTESELGVSEIADKLSLPKSTVSNVLSTFQNAGYLRQNSHSNKYALDYGLLKYGYIIIQNLRLRQLILPYMHQISNTTNQVCMLAVPYQNEVLYLDSAVTTKNQWSLRHITGETAPLYCTGLGKVILAFQNDEMTEHYLQCTHFEKITENTLCTEMELRENIAMIRRNGYALDDREHEENIKCVAFPILSKTGSLIAAVSVTGNAGEFDQRFIEKTVGFVSEILSPLQFLLSDELNS